MKVVLDTNVLVSALLSPFENPASILRSILCGDLLLCYDSRIISEYREVLQRNKFNFEQQEINDLITYLEDSGELIIPKPLKIKLQDIDDLPFIEVAASANADYLITGNKKHFNNFNLKVNFKVVSPSEFIEMLS